MKTRLVPLLLVLAVVALAGCGSSAKKTSSPSSSGTPATQKDKMTTTAKLSGKASSCPELTALGAQFQAAFAASNAAAKGDPALQAKNGAKLFAEFAAKAPSEIRSDFAVFAKALGAYADAIGKAHIKKGQVPTSAQIAKLSAAAGVFNGPELKQATAHVTAWAQKHCPNSGFGTATTQ